MRYREGRNGSGCPGERVRKKCLRPGMGNHKMPVMVRNAYSYWFGFWSPHTIGRGANL
jgi:hypothetical protein